MQSFAVHTAASCLPTADATSHVIQTGVSTWHQLLYPTTADDAILLMLCSLHSTDSLCCQLLAASAAPVQKKQTGEKMHLKKKLIYLRGTARCVVSLEILPVATQQCRNYLYDKSLKNRSYEVGGLQWADV